AFSSSTNNRAERVVPDVAFVLVAWTTAMLCPSVLQFRLECTSHACAAEMFVNQSDAWKRRRPLHKGGGRYLGRFAALNFSLGTGASDLAALERVSSSKSRQIVANGTADPLTWIRKDQLTAKISHPVRFLVGGEASRAAGFEPEARHRTLT